MIIGYEIFLNIYFEFITLSKNSELDSYLNPFSIFSRY